MNDHEFFELSLERPEAFVLPFEAAPYPCLIWAGEPTSEAFKSEVARRLVESDCRYAVCGGVECSAWETAVDLAFIGSDPDFAPPDERLVMTTAHEGESPDEAAFFFVVNTCFDYHDFRRYLILFVGANDAARIAVSERVTHYAKPTHSHDEAG